MKYPTKPKKEFLEITNPKAFVYKERYVRRCMHWAIKTFDKPFQGQFTVLRLAECMGLVKDYLSQGLITAEQHESLRLMLTSPDRNDWIMAFYSIIQIKNFKKKPRR